MRLDLAALAVAFVGSVSLTAPVRQLALRMGMVDRPNPRKLHVRPVPLLGGLAIYGSSVLAVFLLFNQTARAEVISILVGATLLVLVGFLDDRGLLHHQVKLFIAMPAAALLLLSSGVRAHVISAFIPGEAGFILDCGLTIFWVVGITASFSILDHMDGLCAGITAVASAFFMVFSILNGQILVSTMAAAILGASLGFLGWNFNPAKIFMGDGGAMFLGFMMATLSLKLRLWDLPVATRWMVPLLILGVPVFDTVMVSVSRTRRGLIPFTSPGKDHTAHRLANLGLGQRKAVLALYSLGFVFGMVALVVSRLPVKAAYGLTGLAALLAATGIALLEQAPFERQGKAGV